MANLDSPQWKRAQQTSLWKRTLGLDDEDVKPLRESFLDARKNAAFLLDKIRPDFPNLTIHDITHVDSLWSVADTIIGENYPINPLEGYVLGIAFLIHDAALSYDAVGGKEKLRATLEWQDAYADGPGDKDETKFEKECDFTAIRAIHAREAKEILGKTFSSDDIPSFHIIKKASYRQSLGEIIGKIAASHHWSIDEVESKLDIQITPSVEVSGAGNWDINEQKLACILRCADAGHIDDGRAPYYIFRSLIINGVSLEHWKSQNRLGIVRPYIKDASKLLITSTSSFKKEDFAAWNVAYEAIRVFDEELKKSNNLLKTIDKDLVFPHTGVMGVNSKEELANYIKTEGWQPCDVGVHTSDVKLLIENLGGSKLYGEKNMLLVVLRELIQNARDAIHARQKMDDSFNNGRVTVRLIEEGSNRFIEVEDNGIGMSIDCIKHNLLDFGRSYWKSSLSKEENPGLRSKKFESIGKFGIGFYSVFMVAKSVEVRTKRYDKGNKEAKRVEFPAGLTLTPILSNCELESGISTVVRFHLRNDVDLSFEREYKHEPKPPTDLSDSLCEAMPRLVAGLDADVYFNEECIHIDITSSRFDKFEWLKGLYHICPQNLESISETLEYIIDENGVIRGLLSLINDDVIIWPNAIEKKYTIKDNPSIITIGGLMTSLESPLYRGFIGFLDCKENSIRRDDYIVDDTLKRPLSEWFKAKYIENYGRMIKEQGLSDNFGRFIVTARFKNELTNDLLNQNIQLLFSEHLSEIEIGTLEGLKRIHRFLYAGLVEASGIVRNGFTFKDDRLVEINEKVCLQIDSMPDNNFEEIILKLMKVLELSPFLDMFLENRTNIVEFIWTNLMLDRFSSQMIDWGRVPDKEFSNLFDSYKNNKDNTTQICDFLKKYLCETKPINTLIMLFQQMNKNSKENH